MFDAAGVLATAAALTFAVMRFGAMSGSEPDHWRRQLTSLGDRGKALVMAVSSGLPNDWELPSVRLPQMSRPSEFPQHLRMMSPINRVKKPEIELPETLLPEAGEATDNAVTPNDGVGTEMRTSRMPFTRPSSSGQVGPSAHYFA